MLRLHAPAKINLFLRVLAREASGYHQLETLFAGLAFGDELSVESTFSGISLETTGLSLGPVEDNLAYKAAKAFLDEAGLGTGVSIQLEKRTPLGGGLGGGSSDAAAVLKALNRLHPGRVTVARLLEMAGDLGSDVPFFLSPSSMALAWGRGDRFWPLSSLEPRPVVLVLSPFHVSTPDAFSQLAEARKREGFRGRPAVMDPAAFSQWDTVSAMGHNDFEDVVFERHPEAREVLEGPCTRAEEGQVPAWYFTVGPSLRARATA